MYALNPQAARQAEQRSERITEIGKYVGQFTRAEDIESSKGTRGIDFAFVTADKQTANFTLWTFNSAEKELFGFKQLQALMTCLRVKNIDTTERVVKKWDSESQQVEEFDADVFLDLMDKPIGILFETEDYQKRDGSIGTKVVPAAFFEASSELMASEILDKKAAAHQLAKMIPNLRHRPLRNAPAAPTPATRQAAPAGGGFDDMDDDIPF
jgi:hypothetical protein